MREYNPYVVPIFPYFLLSPSKLKDSVLAVLFNAFRGWLTAFALMFAGFARFWNLPAIAV